MTSDDSTPDAPERTPPEAAIEALVIWLNLQQGQTVPLNRLANQSRLAWATASKYVALIERLQSLLPRIERTQSGVRVFSAADRMRPILDDPASAAALALMMRDRNQGELDPGTLSDQLQQGLDDLRDIDGVMDAEGEPQLTPAGWTIANDAYAEAMTVPPSDPEDLGGSGPFQVVDEFPQPERGSTSSNAGSPGAGYDRRIQANAMATESP